MMKIHNFEINNIFTPLFLIAGPCVIESKNSIFDTASYLQEITNKLNMNLIFQSSFDIVDKSSNTSYKSLGMNKSLEILYEIKNTLNIPIITDVHDISQIDLVASVVDVLQIPEFLCNQKYFISKCASTLKPINIKKSQFLSPYDMKLVVDKARNAAINSGGDGKNIMICERGVSCGYNSIIADMRSLMIMRENNCPIIFDTTNSLQTYDYNKLSSGSNIEFVSTLSRAAVAVGISGIFIKINPNISVSKLDDPNSIPLLSIKSLLESLIEIDYLIKNKFL